MNPDEEEWLEARLNNTSDPRGVLPSDLLYTHSGLPVSYTAQVAQAGQVVRSLTGAIEKMVESLRQASQETKKHKFPYWSDNVTPGSEYVISNNIKKKEGGVNLRKSVTSDMTLGRPRASKSICRTHGKEYIFSREDLTWGCAQCDKGRVPFSKWYKDTYSLGYFPTHCFGAGGRSEMSQEVVLSADENFNPIALMVQRSEPGVDAPVYVTDLGKIAVDLSVKRIPGEDGVRRIDIGELYGVPQNPAVLDEEEMKPEPDDDEEPSSWSRISK